MKTSVKLVLSGLGLAALTTLAIKPADAFAPFDWIKSKLSPEQQSQMETYHSERDEVLGTFLGLSADEVREQLSNGKRPWQLAEEQGKDISEWRAARQSIKEQHQHEFGTSGYQRGSGMGRGSGRGMMGVVND